MAVVVNGSAPFSTGAGFEPRSACGQPGPSRVGLRGFVWGLPIAALLWISLAGAVSLLF